MKKNKGKRKSWELAAQGCAANEVVDRYGNAAKQHLVAYSGRDNEDGTNLTRSLKKISESKINSDYRKQNIRQQSGFSAEVEYVARQNAENIIKGDNTRYSRTDDLGRVNDPVLDIVRLDSDGIEIPGTGEQMKFVGSNPVSCLAKLKSKKFEKYLDHDVVITVPSDYFEGIKKAIDNEINSIRKQEESLAKNGSSQTVASIKAKEAKLLKIKKNLKNSGITNEEARYARLHPAITTGKEIVKISHRSGVDQAKQVAVISGGVSLIKNFVSYTKGEVTAEEAAKRVMLDTGKGTFMAYMTAFAGTILKANMQNSRNSALRSLSRTDVPSLLVTYALDAGSSIKCYMEGDISGVQCVNEIVEKSYANMGASVGAMIGRAAIPLPIVGSLIGSTIGYSLGVEYYKCSKEVLKDDKLSSENRKKIEKNCAEAKHMIMQYRKEMNALADEYFNHYENIFKDAFTQMDKAFLSSDIDLFIDGANKITQSLNGEVQFSTMKEFEELMNSPESFKL